MPRLVRRAAIANAGVAPGELAAPAAMIPPGTRRHRPEERGSATLHPARNDEPPGLTKTAVEPTRGGESGHDGIGNLQGRAHRTGHDNLAAGLQAQRAGGSITTEVSGPLSDDHTGAAEAAIKPAMRAQAGQRNAWQAVGPRSTPGEHDLSVALEAESRTGALRGPSEHGGEPAAAEGPVDCSGDGEALGEHASLSDAAAVGEDAGDHDLAVTLDRHCTAD